MSTQIDTSDELLLAFIEESVDGLRGLSDQITQHQQNPGDGGYINAVFRSVHSIKGNAGFFGLTSIKKFAHAVENKLDDVRNDKLPLVDDLLRCFIESFDLLEGMLQGIVEGGEDHGLGAAEQALLENLELIAADNAVEVITEERLLSEIAALVKDMADWDLPAAAQWCARLQPLLPNEQEAESAEAEAPATLNCHSLFGIVDNVQHPICEYLLPIATLFKVTTEEKYNAELGKDFVEAANGFAAWSSENGHPTFADAISTAVVDFRTLDSSPIDIDASLLELVWDRIATPLTEMLTALDLLSKTGPAEAASGPAAVPDSESGRTPENNAQESNVQENNAKEESSTNGETAEKNGGKTRFVRVKEQNLDEFLDAVASLYITGERLKDVQSRLSATDATDCLVEELRQINSTFSRQTVELQKNVASVRRIPARGLLSKFPRMARGLATNLGKKLNVQVTGEDTEIDKSLVEDLDAPLTHMIRNVCDHGIEPPDARLASGKPEEGTLSISCEQTKSHVVIVVSDDGRGIDPEKVGAKAVEKGAITAAQLQAMSRQEKVNLVFHPGFSTAAEITDVSGRGVGLDVVRTTLRDLDGDLSVDSVVGQGTTFRLEIPIRHAVVVIDGLLVEQSKEQFLVPFNFIREIFELQPHELSSAQGSLIATLRGEPYGAQRLSELLKLEQAQKVQRQGVLVEHQQQSVCLLVDRVIGQQKVVVNNLGDMLQGASKFTGVAQLGGGNLTLVLSIPDLIASMRSTADTTSICLA